MRFEFQQRRPMTYRVLTGLFFILSLSVSAQKQIRTFYDPMRRHVKEDYFVAEDDNEMIQGKYKRYFPNGKVELEGAFIDGKRSGIFLEYGENGLLLRKISYVQGLRH